MDAPDETANAFGVLSEQMAALQRSVGGVQAQTQRIEELARRIDSQNSEMRSLTAELYGRVQELIEEQKRNRFQQQLFLAELRQANLFREREMALSEAILARARRDHLFRRVVYQTQLTVDWLETNQ